MSYETFLRRYPTGSRADEIRGRIRERFVPADEEWQEAWSHYSHMETIVGAMYDPQAGVILLAKPEEGRLPPFCYEDLIVALRCTRGSGQVGVTMARVFEARFDEPDDPQSPPYVAYETSVQFYSTQLWNTHLAFILFEGDRMLKSLSGGFDIFRGEPIRSSVPGFATVVEMAAKEPPAEGSGDYGRIWIELTGVRINTTEDGNVAMFSDVEMEVRAESKHGPPTKFARHLQDHYAEYAAEFVIFAEIERAARIVAIAQWLDDKYPDVTRKIASDSFEPVKVVVPQVIRARWHKTHDLSPVWHALIGGVIFPPVNDCEVNPNARVAQTPLVEVPGKVIACKPRPEARAWSVTLGKSPEDIYIAWQIVGPTPDVATHRFASPALCHRPRAGRVESRCLDVDR